jgi:XTP/dITP diphosphohydrolase
MKEENPSIAALKDAVVNHTAVTPADHFDRVVNLVRVLRSECPWDRKQTPESLAHLLLEESYELVHAIDAGDDMELKKEIGDLFLHLCFQVSLAEEEGTFSFVDVFEALCNKLITRHPHVFSDTLAETEQDVLGNWENLKMKEGRKSLLDGVPNAMSELLRAYRVQKKVAGVGFDWSSDEGVLDKLTEEIAELRNAANHAEREDEFGDLLFTIVNYSRFIDANPEDSLRKATNKFMGRFRKVEEQIQASGRDWQEFTSEELDVFWQQAKKEL